MRCPGCCGGWGPSGLWGTCMLQVSPGLDNRVQLIDRSDVHLSSAFQRCFLVDSELLHTL